MNLNLVGDYISQGNGGTWKEAESTRGGVFFDFFQYMLYNKQDFASLDYQTNEVTVWPIGLCDSQRNVVVQS